MLSQNSPLNITKKIMNPEYRGLDSVSNMDEFVQACDIEWNASSFEQKAIIIKEATNISHLTDSLLVVKNLSFEISARDAARVINQLLDIVSDPRTVATFLKDLDTILGKRMGEIQIEYTDHDYPQFLIAVYGHYAPGPPPENYKPKKKGRLLDTILLEREQGHDINLEGSSPIFVGGIHPMIASDFIASGHIFTENKQISGPLVHGPFAHRLMFDALCYAVETQRLDLRYGENDKLSPKQLLELLTLSRYYDSPLEAILTGSFAVGGRIVWDIVIDQVAPSDNRLFDPDHYGFNCGDPSVFSSLLLCFGKELDLPNLQHYLLDSHWKAAYEMVYRVKLSAQHTAIPDSRIYTYCMEAFAILDKLEQPFPFTLNTELALLHPDYELFDQVNKNIVTKKKQSGETGEYHSWEAFFEAKKLLSTPSSSSVSASSSPSDNHDDNVAVLDNFDELKPQAKIELLQNAFASGDKQLCLEIINKQVDFYQCKVNTTNAQSEQLFNELCNEQAKFNVKQFKKIVFETGWGVIPPTGEIIHDEEQNKHKRVPIHVEQEWREAVMAEEGKETYYEAWKNMLELRIKAAQSESRPLYFLHFPRRATTQDHYTSAYNESTIPTLKKGTMPLSKLRCK